MKMKHHLPFVAYAIDAGGVTGPFQPPPPKPATKAAEAKVAQAHESLTAMSGDEAQAKGGIDKEAFVRSREAFEGPDAKERLAAEFEKYAGEDGVLQEAEFLQLMTDRAQAGGNTDLGVAGQVDQDDLSAEELEGLQDRVEPYSEATLAKQKEYNQLVEDGKIAGPPLREDGLEGPRTRAVAKQAEEYAKSQAPQPERPQEPKAETPTSQPAPTPTPTPGSETPGAERLAEIDAMGPVLLDKLSLAERQAVLSTTSDARLAGKVLASLARTNPEALTPEVMAVAGDDAIRAFMKAAADDPGARQALLDKLPVATRAAMIRELAGGWTSSEEDDYAGELAASIGRTDPTKLTPELIEALDDDGLRAFMNLGGAGVLPNLSADARAKMLEVLGSGWTSADEAHMIDEIKAINART